ncbi:MAG: hypothetical protein IPK79_01365 [Vampirovibrionales bacterium]|nr:hypothetical protein [Vampirovibrionales bacterium]
MNIFENMAEVLKQPVVGELDLGHLFLLVGLVIVFIAVWAFVLRVAKGTVETVTEVVTETVT